MIIPAHIVGSIAFVAKRTLVVNQILALSLMLIRLMEEGGRIP